jgi:hypothetical protein
MRMSTGSAATCGATLAEAGASCGTGTKTLFIVYLGAVTFSVGPVPVALVPAISATLSAGGGLSGSVTTSATGTAEVHAGVDYYDGQAHPVGGITPKLTGGAPPTLEGSGHVGATISPAINVLIYGVGGPKAAVNVGLSLDASVGGDDDPRQCLIGREALVLRPKRGILEGLPDVVGNGAADRADLLAHR